MPDLSSFSVNIVGGGIAGLIAATRLGRAGVRVALFEAASTLGGRARTREHDGFSLNQGPHALYRRGALRRELDALGVRYSGGRPLASGYKAIRDGRLHELPVDLRALLGTGLFGLRDKITYVRLLRSLAKRVTAEGSFADWLETQRLSPVLRTSLEALARLTGYANAPKAISAQAMLDQIRMGLGGTLYLDGGWSTLVAGLAQAARDSGATLHTSARVERVLTEGRRSRIAMADGEAHVGDAVILAVGPHEAAAMTAGVASLAEEAQAAIPVRANTLDLALCALPEGASAFGLGIDKPHYFSVHSGSAKLAPAGGAVVHVAKYLPTDEMPGRDAITDLEAVADMVMPGWRPLEVKRQELRGMIVANSLPRWDRPRPGVSVPDAPGLFIAGDWVGGEGMIADAAAASAAKAAQAVIHWLGRNRARAAA